MTLLFKPINIVKASKILEIFSDCMKGRIRVLTASTPTYVHALQATCLTPHMLVALNQNFRIPKLKARYPYFPNARSTTCEVGFNYRRWAVCIDGGTRVVR